MTKTKATPFSKDVNWKCGVPNADEEQYRLSEAARSGTAVGTVDRRTGQVIVFPKGLTARFGMMRQMGLSEAAIKEDIKSLLAHEEIHSVTNEEWAKENWGSLHTEIL